MLSKIELDKNNFEKDAWFIAIGTSKFISGPISEIDNSVDESTLLELRVFDESREIKFVRGSLGGDFKKRVSNFAKEQCSKTCEEAQYLDIDTDNKSKFKCPQNNTWATGGGEYRLPDYRPDRIVVEHYYKADEKGFYRPFDFRIVKFLKKEEKFNEFC